METWTIVLVVLVGERSAEVVIVLSLSQLQGLQISLKHTSCQILHCAVCIASGTVSNREGGLPI